MTVQQLEKMNGIDADALKFAMSETSRDPKKGAVKFQVTTKWKGGTQSETRVTSWNYAGRDLPRNYTIPIDEPQELFGTDTAPNPQETLMAGLNGCMLAGYVTGCALEGIELERLEIETQGELDMRGFLGVDKSVTPGYEEIRYTVRIKGSGTPKQFRKIHSAVMATSPNFWNLSQSVKLNPKLVVD